MKTSSAAKPTSRTSAFSAAARGRFSRVLAAQLIASSALVAPFAAGPAFAQSTLGLGSVPTAASGNNANLSAPGDIILNFDSDGLPPSNTFKVQGGTGVTKTDFLVIQSDGTTTFNGRSTLNFATIQGNGAPTAALRIVNSNNAPGIDVGNNGIERTGYIKGATTIDANGMITGTGGATITRNIAGNAVVSIDNLAGVNGANGAFALNLNGDGIQNAGTISGATLNTATL